MGAVAVGGGATEQGWGGGAWVQLSRAGPVCACCHVMRSPATTPLNLALQGAPRSPSPAAPAPAPPPQVCAAHSRRRPRGARAAGPQVRRRGGGGGRAAGHGKGAGPAGCGCLVPRRLGLPGARRPAAAAQPYARLPSVAESQCCCSLCATWRRCKLALPVMQGFAATHCDLALAGCRLCMLLTEYCVFSRPASLSHVACGSALPNISASTPTPSSLSTTIPEPGDLHGRHRLGAQHL